MTRHFSETEVHAFAESFAKLLPAGFAASARAVVGVTASEALWPEEWAQARPFRATRRQEFAAGRAAARHALVLLGHPAAALPIGPGREPLWPPGITGSISHTFVTGRTLQR